MPKVRDGYTQKSLLVPNGLLKAFRKTARGVSLNAAICAAMAEACGYGYEPPKRGRVPDAEKKGTRKT